MYCFSYNATDRNGAPLEGRMEAESVADAVAQLEQQGLTLLSIQMQGEVEEEVLAPTAPDVPILHPDSHDPLADPILLQRVESLLSHREKLLPLFRGLAKELPLGAKRRQLQKMVAQLETAKSADELIQTKVFARTWLPVLAGQARSDSLIDLQGVFDEILDTGEIRRQQVRSFLYPAIIALLAFAVFVFCSVLLIPSFVDIYSDFDMDLPDLTKFVLNLSLSLINNPLLFVSAAFALIVFVYLVFRALRLSTFLRNIAGGLVRGGSRQLIAMASFLRTLAEARAIGLTAPSALRLAGDSSRPDWIQEEARYLANALEAENSEVMPCLTNFPSAVLSAFRPEVSQHAGVALLKSVAETYSERVRRRFDWATGFAPQIAILFVGLTVALIVVAIYLPLVSLINGLSG